MMAKESTEEIENEMAALLGAHGGRRGIASFASTSAGPMKIADLNALRIFVAVVEWGSFSLAANRLGLPKWSVSRSVSALEAAMGVPLLHRTTRSVTISPAGVALHARVAPLLTSIDLATKAWPEELGEPAGEVHVSAPNHLQSAFFGDVLAQFTARYPAVSVNIHLTGVVPKLSLEGFDVALWLGPTKMKNSSLVARRGWQVLGQFFASPAYLERHGVPSTLADLADHECISFRGFSSMLVETPEGTMPFRPQGHIRCDDLFLAREVVRSGISVGLLPHYLVHKDIASGHLVRVLPRCATFDAYVYVIRPSTREVPRCVKVLSDFFFEYMNAHPLIPPIK